MERLQLLGNYIPRIERLQISLTITTIIAVAKIVDEMLL